MNVAEDVEPSELPSLLVSLQPAAVPQKVQQNYHKSQQFYPRVFAQENVTKMFTQRRADNRWVMGAAVYDTAFHIRVSGLESQLIQFPTDVHPGR